MGARNSAAGPRAFRRVRGLFRAFPALMSRRISPVSYALDAELSQIDRRDPGAASGRSEAQDAVGAEIGLQPASGQHVVDVCDQLACGKAGLVGVEHVLVEYHRHQFR